MPQLTPDELQSLCEQAQSAMGAPHFGRAKIAELRAALTSLSGGEVIFEAISLLVMNARKLPANQIYTLEEIKSLIETVTKSAGQHQHNYNEGGIMAARDSYSAVQAGAQGPNAHAHDMNFQQTWLCHETSIDLSVASGQLNQLLAVVKTRANTPEEYSALPAIASAEMAAKNKDGPGMLQHLAACGEWTLGIAKEIGVTVAATAISKAMGLPG